MMTAAGLQYLVLVSIGVTAISPLVLVYFVVKDVKGRKLW